MNKAFPDQKIVNAADVDPQHIFCPQCEKTGNLRLHGNVIMPRQETYVAGGEPIIEVDASDPAFEVKRIDCFDCRKTSHLISPDLYESQLTVHFLANYIRKTTGKDMLETGMVN